MSATPNRLNIELSAACSYKCGGCPNTYMSRRKGHMHQALFEKLYHEVDGVVQSVFLWNFGESLLNPAAPEIISSLRNSRSRYVLSTTGGPLRKLNDVSFLDNLDELIVSVNGFDQDTYAFHQVNGSLHAVREGLERLQPVMENASTHYVLQTVVNTKNQDDIEKAREFGREFGFNTLRLKTFNVMDNKPETGTKYLPETASLRRDSTERRAAYPCEDWMVVNWNGDTNVCCWDYEGKLITGNVGTTSVFDVWNSRAMATHRNTIASGMMHDFCVDCKRREVLLEERL